MKKQIIAIPAALLVALSLAACGSSDKSTSGETSGSAAAPATEQTVTEACDLANAKLTDFSAKYSSVMTEFATDPTAATAAMEEMGSDLEAVSAELTNTEVSTAWKGFMDGYTQLLTAAKDSDTTALQTAMTTLTDGATQLDSLCGISAQS